MILLDTDILIDIQRGVPQALDWFRMLPEIPAIPGLVAMEIIQSAQNRLQQENSLRFLRPFQVVWPGPADGATALDLFVRHHLGNSLGLIDALIAATAIGLGTPLHTFNQKHFGCVEDLTIVRPYLR
jgi:predicted nucleic acid-binding protein